MPLGEAVEEYRTINRYLRILGQAYRTDEEAMALLPGYAGYLERDPTNEKVWESAVQGARELHELLNGEGSAARPPLANLPERMNKIDRGAGALQDDLEKLRAPLRPDRLETMIGWAGRSDPAAWSRIDALLDCPWLTFKERATLARVGRSISTQVLEETLKADWQEDQSRKPTAPQAPFDSERAAEAERERALRRARLSITLLKLEGLSEVADLDKALAAAERDRSNPATWQALGRLLHEAWTRRLPERLRRGQD
jgi:hypothetical protein